VKESPGIILGPPCASGQNRCHAFLVDDDTAVVILRKLFGAASQPGSATGEGAIAEQDVASRHRIVGRFDVLVYDLTSPCSGERELLQAILDAEAERDGALTMTGEQARALHEPDRVTQRQELRRVVAQVVEWHRLDLERRTAPPSSVMPGQSEDNRARTCFDSALESLWLASQPIVSWSAKSVFGYEVLARTEEPTLRNPVALLELAERLGQTATLGRAIRRRVADLMEGVIPGPPIFVNVHPSDLEDPDLLATDGTLSPFASRVVLEITERAGLDKVAGLDSRLSRLRALGYRIALDDMGAGYAGLSSLAHLEPDIVKVDMSLMRGLNQSPIKQTLFAAIVSLCRDLGIAMIAEGIETRAELECAVSLGGNLFQGYLFGRPGLGLPTDGALVVP
jgi:EAL domain-containing protein (putative c-di-GMP-specific phosphodiesterase class I)